MEDCLGISYNKVIRKNGSTTYNAKGNYRMTQYADDFVIFAKSKEEIEKVYDILNPYLEERGLILAEDKTRITHISEGLIFSVLKLDKGTPRMETNVSLNHLKTL